MMATSIVQPLDLIKTRMQLSGEMGKAATHTNTFNALQNVIRHEGVGSLYKGLSAALFRQATYTSTRMGVYMTLQDMLRDEQGNPPGFFKLLLSAMAAGGIGAVVGTPAEVALIRMTSDGRLPPDQRRNYKNVFDALARVSREEGVISMWKGCSPTVIRAIVLNAAQLSVYSEAKKKLLATGHFQQNVWLHLPASIISGFVCTVVSLPVDIIKTRIQTMRVINGVPEYLGPLDCVRKTTASEGLLSLWKGFSPYFSRLAPHSVLTFLFFEQFRLWFANRS